MHDSCGFVGVFGRASAAGWVARGLLALRTRGGGGAGIVALDGGRSRSRRSPGLAWLSDEAALHALEGRVALGASLRIAEADVARDVGLGLVDPPRLPAVGHLEDGPVALIAVGGLVTVPDAVTGAADASDALLELVRRSTQRTAVNRLVDALHGVQGGYVVALATRDRLVVAADPFGVRPAVVGTWQDGVVVASDRRALLAVGATPVRALDPGEVVVVDATGIASLRPFLRRREARCVAEVLALGSADDGVGGRSHEALRRAIGAELFRLRPASAGVVTAATDALVGVALGWSEASGAPCEPLLVDGAASVARVAGRSVVLIAPAGEGTAEAAALAAAGAAEVHVRWPGPPPVWPCPFGVLASAGAAATATGLSVLELRAVVGAGVCDGCVGGAFAVTADTKDGQLPLFRG